MEVARPTEKFNLPADFFRKIECEPISACDHHKLD
jgi:hypothetical protein